ncbi:glycosyltransferase [bacterium]|jgi:glycosyltransferase involved in cell wall biosynthesis|nr:glycosyltransferase [bacterium]
MKVLYNLYPSAFQNPGGGEIQMLQTKKFVEKQGLQVHFFDQWKTDLKDYGILHTFGSVKYALDIMEAAKSKGLKNVLSTICWYDLRSAWHSPDFTASPYKSTLRYLTKLVFPGFPSMRRRMFEISDLLLPNSRMEADQIGRLFAISPGKFFVVPNGVDLSFKDGDGGLFSRKYNIKDFVLYVGRIEPRKNIINMIKAFKNTDRPLVIIGDYVSMYAGYYNQCRKLAGGNVHFLGRMEHNDPLLKSAYKACDVFLMPSWFETPGLSALEAAVSGAKIVITSGGCTKEYFKDFVLYVNPSKPVDICKAVTEAVNSGKTDSLQNHIIKNFSWEKVAEITVNAYRQVNTES